jgi:hypothetical protein
VTNELLKYLEAAPKTASLLEGSPGYRATVLERNVRDIDAAAKGFGVAREDVLLARKIFAEEGWEGLKKAAAAGTVPVALLAAGGLFREEGRKLPD